jgi:hypothetical protein
MFTPFRVILSRLQILPEQIHVNARAQIIMKVQGKLPVEKIQRTTTYTVQYQMTERQMSSSTSRGTGLKESLCLYKGYSRKCLT